MSATIEKFQENPALQVQEKRKIPKEEILSKFENGFERYKTKKLTKAAIDMLSNGADPIEMLSMLLQQFEDINLNNLSDE